MATKQSSPSTISLLIKMINRESGRAISTEREINLLFGCTSLLSLTENALASDVREHGDTYINCLLTCFQNSQNRETTRTIFRALASWIEKCANVSQVELKRILSACASSIFGVLCGGYEEDDEETLILRVKAIRIIVSSSPNTCRSHFAAISKLCFQLVHIAPWPLIEEISLILSLLPLCSRGTDFSNWILRAIATARVCLGEIIQQEVEESVAPWSFPEVNIRQLSKFHDHSVVHMISRAREISVVTRSICCILQRGHTSLCLPIKSLISFICDVLLAYRQPIEGLAINLVTNEDNRDCFLLKHAYGEVLALLEVLSSAIGLHLMRFMQKILSTLLLVLERRTSDFISVATYKCLHTITQHTGCVVLETLGADLIAQLEIDIFKNGGSQVSTQSTVQKKGKKMKLQQDTPSIKRLMPWNYPKLFLHALKLISALATRPSVSPASVPLIRRLFDCLSWTIGQMMQNQCDIHPRVIECALNQCTDIFIGNFAVYPGFLLTQCYMFSHSLLSHPHKGIVEAAGKCINACENQAQPSVGFFEKQVFQSMFEEKFVNVYEESKQDNSSVILSVENQPISQEDNEEHTDSIAKEESVVQEESPESEESNDYVQPQDMMNQSNLDEENAIASEELESLSKTQNQLRQTENDVFSDDSVPEIIDEGPDSDDESI